MNALPTLYKKTSTGKIQQWVVGHEGNIVTTTYGQIDGKQQSTSDKVTGKNIGKANETTPEQQAGIKAKQLWDKQIKKRYVESIEEAEAGESSVFGFKPMLAFVFEKKLKHVIWPGLSQSKLDGLRCLATITQEKAVLTYRTGGIIVSLPHIVEALEDRFCMLVPEDGVIELDGELYNHKYKHNFNKLKSLIKRDDVHPDHTEVQYHIYDHVAEQGYEQRMEAVNDLIEDSEYLMQVPYKAVHNKEELDAHFHESLANGYEGGMYRNPEMGYDNKPERSVGLLKVKVFDDAEFEVVGEVEEGKGKLQGTAGSIWCYTEEGFKFKAKLKAFEDGNGKRIESKEDYQARCKDWLVNIDKYKGKQLTVQFQGRTPKKYDKNGEREGGNLPRFPIALRVRD